MINQVFITDIFEQSHIIYIQRNTLKKGVRKILSNFVALEVFCKLVVRVRRVDNRNYWNNVVEKLGSIFRNKNIITEQKKEAYNALALLL